MRSPPTTTRPIGGGRRESSAAGLAVLALVLSSATGCDAPLSTLPDVATPNATTPASALPPFPDLVGPGRIYVFSALTTGELAQVMSTPMSRYVLYDDGTFALQIRTMFAGAGQYRGTYRVDGSWVEFTWEGGSVMGPWGATAQLADDQLSAQYNQIMRLNDFEDAVYVLEGR